jgi:hypothetical protein
MLEEKVDIRGGQIMFNSIIFTITVALIGYAWILNGILAHSKTPELAPIVVGTFVLGASGALYWSISTLITFREWRESRA